MPPSRTAPRDGNGKKTVGTRAPSRHQGRADGSYRGLKGRKRDCHTGGTVIAEPLGVRGDRSKMEPERLRGLKRPCWC